jgi:hypothetical protein
MGTRGFVGFKVDGTEKIAYNHFDSYPSGLGTDVLQWLRKEHAGHIRRKAAELRVVDPDSKPTAEDIVRLKPYADTNVSTRRLDEWYVLLRETQGNPAAMLDAGVIEDGRGYGGMEYGYLVDLDANELRVYDGNLEASILGRFPLDALPSDEEFVAALERDEEDW